MSTHSSPSESPTEVEGYPDPALGALTPPGGPSPDRAASDASSGRAVATRSLPFEFVGRPGEYFRIWIVNLGLTIATLGVYSAWAKVRTRRYLYASLRLDGVPFEYTASPIAILRGRAIALVIFGAYSLTAQISVPLAVATALGSMVVFPWLIQRSLAFRAHHTTYRNLRFRFDGSYGQALLAFEVMPVLLVASLGLAYPAIRGFQSHYVIDHSRFGSAPFSLRASPGDFYRAIAPRVLLLAVAAALGLALPIVGPVIAIALAVYAYYDARAALRNLTYGRTSIGPHRLASRVATIPLMWLHLSNTLAVILSLGLALPWARIRSARYLASCLTLEAAGGLDDFAAGQRAEVSALGEELSGFFDVDLGL